MAGSNKGKGKKKKGKSNKSGKKKKHFEASDSNLNLGQERSVSSHGSIESGEESLPPTLNSIGDSIGSKTYEEVLLENLLGEKIEELYKKALDKLMALGYDMDVALRAMLENGLIIGESNILTNIVVNSLAVINRVQMKDHSGLISDEENLFEEVSDLVKCATHTFICRTLREQLDMEKCDVIFCLLTNYYSLLKHEHFGDNFYRCEIEDFVASSCSPRDESSQFHGAMLEQMNIHSTPSSKPSQGINFEYVKSLVHCPDEVSLYDWLKCCPDEQKDNAIENLFEQIHNLSALAEEAKDRAEKEVADIEKILNDQILELRMLRLEKIERLKIEKEQLAASKFFSETQRKLKKSYFELKQRENEAISNLKAENQALRADIAAFELSASESEEAMQLALKRQRKNLKKIANSDKQISEFTRQIGEEKKKAFEVEQELLQVKKERREKAELKLQEEMKAKEKAHSIFLEEQRLNRKAKEESKKQLATLKEELVTKVHRARDEMQRLQLERSQLKQEQEYSSKTSSSSSSHASSSRASNSWRSLHGQRRIGQCLICYKNEACIRFLPCTHQVICSVCNNEVYEALKNECPCCKLPIESRVNVNV